MAAAARMGMNAMKMMLTKYATGMGNTGKTLGKSGTRTMTAIMYAGKKGTRENGGKGNALRATMAASAASLPNHTVLGMPALSPTMTSGSVAAWKVSAGTSVAPGDVLAEVETDKATIEWESVDEFVVAKLLVSDGVRDVKVGAPVMVVTENESDVGAFEAFAIEDAIEGTANDTNAKTESAAANEQPVATVVEEEEPKKEQHGNVATSMATSTATKPAAPGIEGAPTYISSSPEKLAPHRAGFIPGRRMTSS